MAATESDDDATATFKGDMEKDFGQEAEKAKAKSDDAEASGKTSGKATKEDAAKNQGKDADGEASRDEKEAFVSPEEPYKSARLAWEARVAAVEAREAREDFPQR